MHHEGFYSWGNVESRVGGNNVKGLPFVKLDLKCTSVREHVVVSTHSGYNGINRTEPDKGP